MATATPAMTQPSSAAVPAAAAASQAPNSQPEPMMDVSEAQVAPISPISRLRPTSVGLVTVAVAPVSSAITEPPSRRAVRSQDWSQVPDLLSFNFRQYLH